MCASEQDELVGSQRLVRLCGFHRSGNCRPSGLQRVRFVDLNGSIIDKLGALRIRRSGPNVIGVLNTSFFRPTSLPVSHIQTVRI